MFGSCHLNGLLRAGAIVLLLPLLWLDVAAAATEAALIRMQEAYIAYYGRPADPLGLDYWANRFDAEGGSLAGVIQAFGTSTEYEERYGGLDNTTLIDNVYCQLFGRSPDPSGKEFYGQQLDSGAMTLQTITLNVLDGARGDDDIIVGNKVDVAFDFTDGLTMSGRSYGSEDINAAVAILAGVGASEQSVDLALQSVADFMGGIYVEDCTRSAGEWLGTFTERYCDGLRYDGPWRATITSSCEFRVPAEILFVEGIVSGNAVTASGVDPECGLYALRATIVCDRIEGAYEYEFGGSGSISGTRQGRDPGPDRASAAE